MWFSRLLAKFFNYLLAMPGLSYIYATIEEEYRSQNTGVRITNKKLSEDSDPFQLKTPYKGGVLDPSTQKPRVKKI